MNFLDKVTSNRITWYHANKAPNKQEQDFLAKKFGFLQHHVDGTEKGKTPRPKISVSKKYTYFVFHIPYIPTNASKVFICDLNIFISGKTLLTIESQGNLTPLDDYFEKTKTSSRVRERRFKLGAANLALNIIKYLLNDVEKLIDEQGEKVDLLNREIFKSNSAKTFIETMSVLRYNQIVTFSAVERQTRTLESYSNDKAPLSRFPGNTDNKWAGLIDTYQTLSYELGSDIEHLEGLVKTFETLVTHRTNETIRVLTVFSVLLLPLTLISGIYGMNFKYIPLSDHPIGFIITIIGMLLLALLMLLYFKSKRWL